MKISENCKNCGSVKLKHQDQSYCVFKVNMSETIIIRDEQDNCIILDKDNDEYKSVLAEFVLTR
ncbi:hypothetical protein [Clostridium akagii]|uniref:hypothetical protein n=1 Tax=Clostridium akagii TaxID=91623 RepID=UPI00047AF04F|nr:hypothetical protein [Clostridium akagii]